MFILYKPVTFTWQYEYINIKNKTAVWKSTVFTPYIHILYNKTPSSVLQSIRCCKHCWWKTHTKMLMKLLLQTVFEIKINYAGLSRFKTMKPHFLLLYKYGKGTRAVAFSWLLRFTKPHNTSEYSHALLFTLFFTAWLSNTIQFLPYQYTLPCYFGPYCTSIYGIHI